MDNNASHQIPNVSTTDLPAIIKGTMEANRYDPTAQVVISLEGPPGIAKTALPRSVAEAEGWGFNAVMVPNLDIVEGKGFPVYNSDTDAVDFKPISIWPVEIGRPQILLLDEFAQGMPPVQASLSNLLYGGRMGEYVLPKDTLIILTGNRSGDKAATYKMPSHIKSRVARMNMTVSVDASLKWMKENNFNKTLMTFLANKPELLHAFEPNDDLYPTNRGWHKVNAIINAGMPEAAEATMIQATVGVPAGSEFLAYRKQKTDLPSPSEILQSPETCRIPTDPGSLHALATGLARKITGTRAEAFLTYVKRLDGEYQQVFASAVRHQDAYKSVDMVRNYVNNLEG